MSDSIEQRADGWYWYDETWAYSYGPLQTKKDAEQAQRHYCVTELERAVPHSAPGDYVWWTPREYLTDQYGETRYPARVLVGADGASLMAPSGTTPNYDWEIRLLVSLKIVCVYGFEIRPMTEMEVIACSALDCNDSD